MCNSLRFKFLSPSSLFLAGWDSPENRLDKAGWSKTPNTCNRENRELSAPFSMIACLLSSIQIATLDHQVFHISFYFFFPCPKRDFTKVQGNPKLFPVSKADSAEAFSTTDSDKGPLPVYSTASRQAFGQHAHNLQPVLIFVFLKEKKHTAQLSVAFHSFIFTVKLTFIIWLSPADADCSRSSRRSESSGHIYQT